LVIAIAQKNVENKRDIDGKPSEVQAELKFVLVIDALVEINRCRRGYYFAGRRL
jgi:hypothetical protein